MFFGIFVMDVTPFAHYRNKSIIKMCIVIAKNNNYLKWHIRLKPRYRSRLIFVTYVTFETVLHFGRIYRCSQNKNAKQNDCDGL